MVPSGFADLIDLKLINMHLAPPEVDQVISRSKIPTPISLYVDGISPYLKFSHLQDGPIVDFSCLQKAEFVVKSQRDICQINDLIKETTRLEYISIKTHINGK